MILYSMEAEDRHLFLYIGQRIRERRQAIGATQSDFAKRMGMLRSSLANIESGRQRIPLMSLYQVCAELKIEITDILPSMDYVIPQLGQSITPDSAPPKTKAVVDRLRDEVAE